MESNRTTKERKVRVVALTGAAGDWGGRTAELLLEHPTVHLIGLDNRPPEKSIKGLDYVQADVRNPALLEFLKSEGVDTVCHLAFEETVEPSEAAFDLNVMGTMRLFGACVESGVRKIIVKSSTAAYGARVDNSLFLTESQPLRGSRQWGYVRDLLDIETFCAEFRQQHPEIVLSVLRFANIVGPIVSTPMTRFLGESRAPSLWGFDPLMQVVHEEDVIGALAHAVLNDAPGVFNIASDGVLPLWRIMALAGKIGLPVLHPLAYWSRTLLGPRLNPLDLDYLRYPCVADLRKMHEELKFLPRFTAEETLREFASHRRLSQFAPLGDGRKEDEDRLRETIERRRRARMGGAKAGHDGKGASDG